MEDITAPYARIHKSSHVHWILSSLLGLVLFGVGNYVMSSIPGSVLGQKLFGSIGYFMFLILMLLAHMIILVQSHKKSVNCSPDSIYNKEFGLTKGFFIAVLGGVWLFAAQLCLLYAWSLDREGAGVVFMMLIGIAPITSILSYLLYNEKFTLMQILGMLVTLSAICSISVTSISGTWQSFLFGFLTMVFYSLRNINARDSESKGLDIYTTGMLNSLGEVFCGFILLIYILIFEDTFSEISQSYFYYAITGATLVALGQYFINQGCMTGNIGVVVTLINLNGPLFILLDLIFRNIFPELKTALLLIVVMLGVIIMLFGDQVVEKFRSGSKKDS